MIQKLHNLAPKLDKWAILCAEKKETTLGITFVSTAMSGNSYSSSRWALDFSKPGVPKVISDLLPLSLIRHLAHGAQRTSLHRTQAFLMCGGTSLASIIVSPWKLERNFSHFQLKAVSVKTTWDVKLLLLGWTELSPVHWTSRLLTTCLPKIS